MAVVGGDQIVKSISAASIIAKVTRDKLMLSMHEKYPNYGFNRHKGYGTKLTYGCLEKVWFLVKFTAKVLSLSRKP